MPDDFPSLFFDTVTISNFALTGAFGLLVRRYGTSLSITEQVRSELAAGRARGYAQLYVVENALSCGSIASSGIMTGTESELFSRLLRTLGSGEASCIALARHRSGVVATDDRAARSCCADYDVPVTGTIGILIALCADRTVTPHEADAILARMVDTGFFSPVRRISDTI
jgi:predicted nucleic acid-binding protein